MVERSGKPPLIGNTPWSGERDPRQRGCSFCSNHRVAIPEGNTSCANCWGGGEWQPRVVLRRAGLKCGGALTALVKARRGQPGPSASHAATCFQLDSMDSGSSSCPMLVPNGTVLNRHPRTCGHASSTWKIRKLITQFGDTEWRASQSSLCELTD